MSPRIVSANANIRHAEVSGVVIIGDETAAKLTKKYKKEFKAGDQVDLGTLAYFDENPIKRWWVNFKISHRRSILN